MAVSKLTHDTQDVRGLVASVISTWRSGARPKACEALAQHPELREHKSAVLDLAHEEYHLRRTKGEEIPASAFCEQFPGFQKSVRRLLNVHWQWVDDSPEALDALVREYEADLDHEQQRVAPIDWPQVGQPYLGFEIHEELGKGAFARVYLASETALGGRMVAIKISRQGTAEAKTLGKLAHPNIVPIHSVHVDPQTQVSAVCMPFLGRATLYDVLDLAFAAGEHSHTSGVILDAAKRGSRGRVVPDAWHSDRALCRKLSYVDAIVRLGAQLADALSYTHSKGVLHRDIKPSNILLTPQGVPMLLDFNLSLDADAVTSLVGGTVPYMAPELLEAVLAENPASVPIDSRADVFSLGAILYELLVGVTPFGDPEIDPTEDKSHQLRCAVTHVLERQSKGPPARNRANQVIDDHLFEIITKCLDFSADDRPQTATVFASQLREYGSYKNRVRRWTRRHRVALGITSGIAACLFGASAVFLAARPSYADREYETGVKALQAEDFQAALGHFDHSVNAHSEDVKFRIARAQAYAQRQDFESAEQDLRMVAEKLPQGHRMVGVVHAQRGYFYALRDDLEAGIGAYTRALEAGYDTPEVRNNLGYCFLGRSYLDRAHTELDVALKTEPTQRVALFNRAILFMNLSGKKTIHVAPGQRRKNTNDAHRAGGGVDDPAEALNLLHAATVDIETALAAGPPHVELHFQAANAYALAHLDDHAKSTAKKVEHHIIAALRLGLDPKKVTSLPLDFREFSMQESIRSLLEQGSDTPTETPFPRVIPHVIDLASLAQP